MCRFGQQTVLANFKQISHAKSFVSSLLIINAFSNPLPRTKEATRDVSHSFLISSRNISPSLYALSANCSSRTTSSAVTATAAAIGFPPKVEPCCPGRITSITSLHDNTAETGQAPPDKAFPKSGYPDEHSHNHKPAICLYGQCRSALHRL